MRRLSPIVSRSEERAINSPEKMKGGSLNPRPPSSLARRQIGNQRISVRITHLEGPFADDVAREGIADAAQLLRLESPEIGNRHLRRIDEIGVAGALRAVR